MRRLCRLCAGALTGLLLGAVGCGPGPASPGDLDLRFARQAIDGPCPEAWASDPSPPSLDKLEVTLWGPDGQRHYHKTIGLSSGKPAKLAGIPAGEDLRLGVTGLVGESPQWYGTAEGVTIIKGRTSHADVFMTRVSDLSCAARPLHRARALLAGARAGDRMVILAGGVDQSTTGTCGDGCTEYRASRAVDIFDPETGVIYTGPDLNRARALATATRLADGAVLVVGGVSRLRRVDGSPMPFTIDPDDLVPTFEVYLPAEQRWIEKPLPGRVGRVFHTATALPDGRVLVTGGGVDIASARDDALIFDPAGESVGDFSLLSDRLNTPRLGHSAIAVGEKVIVIGGAVMPTKSAVEEFSLSGDGGVFTEAVVDGPNINFFFHGAMLLPQRPDEILVAGGSIHDGEGALLVPSEGNVRIYSVSGSQSTDAGPMGAPRLLYQMVALADDTVLLAGGYADLDMTPQAAVDIFSPAGAFSAGADLSVARGGHAAVDAGGRALLAGGQGPDGLLASGEIYTPVPGE